METQLERIQRIRREAEARKSVSTSTANLTPQEKPEKISERVTRLRKVGLEKQKTAIDEYRAKNPVVETRFGNQETIISAPKANTTILNPAIQSRGEMLYEKSKENQIKSAQPLRDFFRNELGGIGKAIFGASEQEFLGLTERPVVENEGFVKSIQEDVRSRGILKLLWGNLTKQENEKINEYAATIAQQGYSRAEANNFATQYNAGNKKMLPPNVVASLDASKTSTKAWASVEVLDLFLGFKGISKTLGKSFVRDTLQQTIATTNATEARNILTKAFPKLQGTQELDDLVSLSRTMADDGKAKQFLDTVMSRETLAPVQSTEAQKVFYENGIPIIRGGETPSTSLARRGRELPNKTADALVLRKEINDVLAGQAEQSRLSNLDVFADEIKSGALPFNAVPENKIKLFVSDEIADAPRLRNGDRLATSKQILEDTLEKGTAKIIEVSPKDVVRLADGTFVYAPKESLAKGVQATMRSLRAEERSKVLTIERQKALSQLRKEIANEADIFNTTLANRERQAAAKASREADKMEAQRVLAEQPIKTQKLLEETRIAKEAKIIEIRKKAKEASKAVTEAQSVVKQINTEIGKAPLLIAKERTKARIAIKKINNLKRLSTKEKAKRRARVIKEREVEIALINKNKTKLQSALPKARVNLINAQKNIIDKETIISKTIEDAKIEAKTLKNDSKELITKAEQTLVQPKPQTKVQKARVKNTEQVKVLTDSIKESFTITSNVIPETVASVIKPVKGEGKTVESQIIKGLTDEVDAIRKKFESRGLSLADLPETHKAIGNPELMKQAFADLIADPAKVYNDLITGALPEGTTRAAYALALMKSDFVLSSNIRTNNVIRAFVKGNTRIAQELQSIKVFGRMDYMSIVGRLVNQSDEILNKRGIDVQAEAKKLLSRFGDEFDELPPMSTEELKKALEVITCPV